MTRRHHGPPWPIFVAIAQIGGAFIAGNNGHPVAPWGFALLVIGPLMLFQLRRHPLISIFGAGAAAAAYLLLGQFPGPIIPSTIAITITAVLLGKRHAAWFLLVTLFAIWGYAQRPGWALLNGLAVAVGIAVLAEFVDVRRQRIRAYRELMAEERKRREEEKRRREGEQRLRIARELHDILAHSLSLINVRASVALELLDSNPEEIRPALETIKQASRDGLTEVRAVLHELRLNEPAERAPAPDLSRLSELVNDAATAGLTVSLDTSGDLDEVPQGVALAAYRIVQEALTNVVRHSQARTAVARVQRTGDGLQVEVTDPGPSTADSSDGGSGLIGIHERAQALGGTASAGPTPDGGFRVAATLPIGNP